MLHDLHDLLTCPVCLDSELIGADDEAGVGWLVCSRCGERYPVRGGIPVLLPPGFDSSGVHDEVDHLHGGSGSHKHEQAAHFDRAVAEEFEINRPHGAPDAYGWLLGEKFRRSVVELGELRGTSVVDVCAGSGMDAEMLARSGARVIAVDISEGCAARSRARAERNGLDYLVIVGDVEHLPVRTASVDIGYVHDGLHHLADPSIGVRELARVSRGAVSINEPAEALATALAVRLGIALEREEAGNRVARLRPEDVARALGDAGFDAKARRYLMYYKHEPGALLRLASRPVARHICRVALTAVNALAGRWGNKLQITALRRPSSPRRQPVAGAQHA